MSSADDACPGLQLSGGQQNRVQSGHQEALQTLPVGALREAGLQRAEAPQAHETRKRETPRIAFKYRPPGLCTHADDRREH